METQQAETSDSKSPLAVLFPPQVETWREVRVLASDSDKRADQAAAVAKHDPALVVELIRAANAMSYSEGKPPVTNVKAAIVRLGVDGCIDVLERAKEIPESNDPEIVKWFEAARTRCKWIGGVAEFLGGMLAKQYVEDTQTAGLLKNVGELIAVLHFGSTYVQIANENARTKVLYRLEKDHKFAMEPKCVNYLTRAGIPEAIVFAIDSTATTKTPTRAVTKPIVSSAEELVLAFETDKWDRYKPGEKLPSKSFIRMLQVTDAQQKTIYEGVGEYLVGAQNAQQ